MIAFVEKESSVDSARGRSFHANAIARPRWRCRSLCSSRRTPATLAERPGDQAQQAPRARVRRGRHLDRSGSQQSVRLQRSSKRSLLLVFGSTSGDSAAPASSPKEPRPLARAEQAPADACVAKRSSRSEPSGDRIGPTHPLTFAEVEQAPDPPLAGKQRRRPRQVGGSITPLCGVGFGMSSTSSKEVWEGLRRAICEACRRCRLRLRRGPNWWAAAQRRPPCDATSPTVVLSRPQRPTGARQGAVPNTRATSCASPATRAAATMRAGCLPLVAPLMFASLAGRLLSFRSYVVSASPGCRRRPRR